MIRMYPNVDGGGTASYQKTAATVNGSKPAVVEELADHPGLCRCGTPLLSGGRQLRLRRAPPRVASLFEGQPFCSGRCVRAYFLETLETLDSVYSGRAAEMVIDLHALYQDIAQTFAALLGDSALNT